MSSDWCHLWGLHRRQGLFGAVALLPMDGCRCNIAGLRRRFSGLIGTRIPFRLTSGNL